MNSIRRQVTWLLIALIVLVTFSAAITGYRASMQDATRLFDGELQAIAATLVALPASQTARASEIESPPDVAWQIWQQDHLLMRSANAPDRPIGKIEKGFSAENFLGNRWRVLTSINPANEVVAMVAHPLGSRDTLTESLILAAMTPLIISIPVLALLIYWVVNRGLRPLNALSAQLENKARNNLEPIALSNTPNELTTVIDTLNSLFLRLNKAFEREQLFSANAAHELRTPLSVLKINLHNLHVSDSPGKDEIARCQRDTDRMIRVINQLLLLSRTNPETTQANLENVEIESMLQEIISEMYDTIDAKHQAISLNSSPCELQANSFALHTMFTNLIGNASKYTPDGGEIEITTKLKTDRLEIQVADSGPGIPPADYEKVLTPFFRVANVQTQRQSGSGIGLAIVNQVVMLHKGKLSLGESRFGGLTVTVTLPRHSSSQEPLC
ncbi:HAMP domain-containing protein [Aestuariibacter sp. GS-14]|uniref:ATP-binding protein n=1 Tax=Aestuariibacter sp. GS-14 TaxID=2590670 RepID=UPI001129038F|nr:ATP-binding protein [Aestuariibacter sp. GS-14]TPV55380.1 HAMP domain-containing protein [Aestuariibacter sp. GS-14]